MTDRTNREALGLEGKVAIVTGGGAADDGIGNGRAAAILLARAGAKVFVVDLDRARAERTVAMIAQEGGTAATFVADITDEQQASAMSMRRSRNSGALIVSTTMSASAVRAASPRSPRSNGGRSCGSMSRACSSPRAMRSRR